MCLLPTCCGRKKYPMARSMSEDLELDACHRGEGGSLTYEHNQFLPCSYVSDCLMKLDKFFYPFSQWLHLMYRDRNPFLIRLECQLCNEPFELFDTIVLPLQCRAREENLDVKPHCFHICCTDIIDLESDKDISEPKSLHSSQISLTDHCEVCDLKTRHEEEDERRR